MIPLHISLDFGDPKFPVGFDRMLSVFPIVDMPEGPVYKNDQLIFFKLMYFNLGPDLGFGLHIVKIQEFIF